MICLSEQGQVLWDSQYTHPGYINVVLSKTIESSDGKLVSIGILEDSTTTKDYGWIHKADSLGETEWSREIINQNDRSQYLRDIEQTEDGGYLMVGSVLLSPNDAWVVKVDSLGCMVAGCDTIHTGISPVPVPEDFYLGDPVPNPTTGMTNISCTLPLGSEGILQVVDLQGRIWEEQLLNEGMHLLELDLSLLPKGVFLCTLIMEEWPAQTKPVVIQ